jgi:glycosyltransferase involved in cell wall biosynthesis
MKRILYISYDGMTDPLGQSQVLPYLCGLSKKGYRITLLSCEKRENFDKSEGLIRSIAEQAEIKWEPLYYTKKPPVLSTLWDVNKLIRRASQLHKLHSFHLVHCRSYISALVGLKMQKKYGCKFVFDMRGFWADERVDGNLWDLNSPIFKIIYKYFKKKEVVFLEKADYTISLTENARSEIHSWSKVSNNPVPIEVIPCCVDVDLFSPEKIAINKLAALRSDLNLSSNDFVLSYLGAIGTWYMLDEMLDFYKQLHIKRANASFLFITAEDPKLVYNKAELKGIPLEKILVKRAERQDVPLYIALSSASVFFIKPAYSKKASSPTKQGELMSMGIPVVCNAGVGDTDYVVNKYDSGFIVDKFCQDSYNKAIDKLLEGQVLSAEQIRKGAIDFYSLQEGISRYSKVYDSLLR